MDLFVLLYIIRCLLSYFDGYTVQSSLFCYACDIEGECPNSQFRITLSYSYDLIHL